MRPEGGSLFDRIRPRLPDGLAVVGAAVAALAFWSRYHSVAPDPQRFAPTDLANYYYPMADLVGRRLAAGELPLWNPASCSGIPLLATLQPGVLYPFSWLAAVLPTADALWLAMLVQVVMAAGFTALALRAWGLHPAAAMLGGALYAQACLLGNLAWPPAVAVMTWLPAQWWCVEKLVRGARPGWWLMLALVTALQLLAGFPQYLVYGFYWLVPYAAIRLWQTSGEGRLRRAAWMAAAVVLGVGIAAAQLLPTAELAAESARGVSLTPAEVHYLDVGTLPAKRLVANALDPAARNPTFDLKAGTGYLGIASVFAVAAALVLRWRSATTIYLVLAGLLALALSDGFHGWASPLFAVYHELPTGGMFRTPERLRFITVVCWIALSCVGLDALLRRESGRPHWTLWGALVATGAAVVLLGGEGSGSRLGFAVALAVALLLGGRAPAVRRGVIVAWVIVVVADVWLATAPAGVLHAYPTELSERYKAAFRSARIEDDQLAALKSLPGHARVEPYGFLPFHAAGDAAGLHRAACYEPLSPAPWRRLSEVLMPDAELKGGLANPAPDRAPVFYDVASVARDVRARRGQAVVRENVDALPRAYQAAYAAVASQEQAFAHVRDASFDFQRGVLVEDAALAGGSPADVVPARIVSHRPERVEVAVASDRDAWLVLTDTDHPGWSASVDGRAAGIVRANGLYRAVRIRAGDERVVFEYRPASWRWGIAVSLLSLAVVLCVTAVRVRLLRAKHR